MNRPIVKIFNYQDKAYEVTFTKKVEETIDDPYGFILLWIAHPADGLQTGYDAIHNDLVDYFEQPNPDSPLKEFIQKIERVD